jgi:hypothetical protein
MDHDKLQNWHLSRTLSLIVWLLPYSAAMVAKAKQPNLKRPE